MTKEEVKQIIMRTGYNIYTKQLSGLLKYKPDDSEYLELLNIYDKFSDIEKERCMLHITLHIEPIYYKILLLPDEKYIMFKTFKFHKNNAQIMKKLAI